MIYDITKFASPSEIKQEINKVYVTKYENYITYVATDTFRLIEIKQEIDGLNDIVAPGFYTIPQWKILCKAFQKKDTETIKTIKPIDTEMNYPDYKRIIPNSIELRTLTKTIIEVDIDYWYDFTKFIKSIFKKERHIEEQHISQSQDSKMIIYKRKENDIEITFLLMGLNK